MQAGFIGFGLLLNAGFILKFAAAGIANIISFGFHRGLRSWIGFRQIAIAYDRPERKAGKTSYSFYKLYRLATDGIACMSIRPLKIAQLLAFIYLSLTLLVVSYILFGEMYSVVYDFKFMTLLLAISISNSVVLLCLYILGAYVGRTYLEAKGRPSYIIEEIMDKGEWEG